MCNTTTTYHKNKKHCSIEDDINNNSKEEKRDKKFQFLSQKYFNKISDKIIKAQSNSKSSIFFHYNYYDFVNDHLGKPHGLLNEFMYEMCYSYSKHVMKDTNSNSITFKSLFGEKFNWQLRGKNMMIISW